MALRLLEIVIPEEHVNEVLAIIEEAKIENYWQTCGCESRVIYKLILPAENTEKIMDELEKRYGQSNEFHMALLPVEATFPSPKEIEEKQEEEIQSGTEEKENRPSSGRQVLRYQRTHCLWTPPIHGRVAANLLAEKN